jgi:CubicO group peptidase (beta-lactamase class C family)
MRDDAVRRARLAGAALAASIACLAAAGPTATAAPPPEAATAASVRAQIDRAVRQAIAKDDLRAVILQVTVGGRTLMTNAYGESMAGVPATTDMHFRNGAVAISYMSTLLLRLVDQGRVSLDDPVAKWLPNLREGRRVTLRMLAGMTAGYHDYEADPRLIEQLYGAPFEPIGTRRQLGLALSRPQLFEPGTNWSYSHSDYVILGLALERITGQPLDVALRRRVLRPLGLRDTVASQTGAIPSPVLHAYSSERREFLGITGRTPFLEESTFWNPSWTLARGAVQTTTISDMTRTAIGIGSGRLLSRRSYEQMMDARIGFGRRLAGCEACRTMDRVYGYGIGVVRNGSWSLQNPLFGGYAGVEAYLPSRRISIALATTFTARSYDAGNPQGHTRLFGKLGAILAPDDPPVTRG